METKLSDFENQECQVLLEEYKRLNTEILKRIDFYDKNINYQFILLGIVISAISTILAKDPTNGTTIHYILLSAPLIFYFLGFYNSINNMYTFKIAHYISDIIRPRLEKLLRSDTILKYEEYIQHNVFRTAKKKNRIVTFIVLQWTLLIPLTLLFGYLFLIKVDVQELNNKKELWLLVPNSILLIISFYINSKQFNIITDHKNKPT